MAEQLPQFLDALSYSASSDRAFWLDFMTDAAGNSGSSTDGGVVADADLTVTQNGTPNMSVNVSSGVCYVKGDVSATQGFYRCLAPHTRILKTDLTWIPISKISPGDELVGFIENDTRVMSPSTVEAVNPHRANSYEISTNLGNVTCSENHMWPVMTSRKNSVTKWMSTKAIFNYIFCGRYVALVNFVKPWETDDSRDGGYIAGILDGEGSMCVRNRDIAFTQNRGIVWDTALRILHDRGFDIRIGHDPNKKNLNIANFRGIEDSMCAIGMFRPPRFLTYTDEMLFGIGQSGTYRRQFRRVKINSVKHIGEQDVVGIQTSTRTLIAEGFLTHNCYNDATVNKTIAAAHATLSRRDIVVAHLYDNIFDASGNNFWALEVITGTPASSPVDPTTPTSTLKLARIAVAPAVTSIVNANITDLALTIAPVRRGGWLSTDTIGTVGFASASDNGKKFLAGGPTNVNVTSGQGETTTVISFGLTFGSTPKVVATLGTVHPSNPVAVRVTATTTTNFTIGVERSDGANFGATTTYNIYWMAIG